MRIRQEEQDEVAGRLAKIKTDEGKKLLVDMGPQDKLQFDVQKGSKLTVTGPAVKVKDRLMLIARQVTLRTMGAPWHADCSSIRHEQSNHTQPG